jgi:excisionase family DNA binding protein
MSNNLMTVDEVARELRVSARKIYQFIQSGELIATNIGTVDRKIFRITRSDFDAFLQSRRQKRQES